MSDITTLAAKLKAAAEKVGIENWKAQKISGDNYVIRSGSYKREKGYCTYSAVAEIDDKKDRDFIALANPANILELVEALEAAEKRIAELEKKLANPVLLPKTYGYWDEKERAYEEAITLAKRRVRLAGFRCEGDE